MLLHIRFKTEAQKNDEDIEVAYVSVYPKALTEDSDSRPVIYIELKEPKDGSLIRHINLDEVENLWFRLHGESTC